MNSHRLMGRGHLMVAVCLLGALASNASAAHIPGMSQLGGFTYIDRNNDGQIAFVNDPNPEYAIGNVSISLFCACSIWCDVTRERSAGKPPLHREDIVLRFGGPDQSALPRGFVPKISR